MVGGGGVKGDGEFLAVLCAAFVQVVECKTCEVLTECLYFVQQKYITLVCSGTKIIQYL